MWACAGLRACHWTPESLGDELHSPAATGRPQAVQVYLQRIPSFAGRRYSELQAYLPHATVYGPRPRLRPLSGGQCRLLSV
jgi:hypothetical protein